MQFSSVLLALSTAAGALALNSFTTPIGNETLYAGETFIIRWNNTDGGATVDLFLKKGNSSNLEDALTISTGLENAGAVRWFLPEDIVTGTDYALEIVNKDNGNDINYSPYFTIIGQNVTSTTSSTSIPPNTVHSSTADSTTAHNSTTEVTTTAEATTTDASASSNATVTGSTSGSSSAHTTNASSSVVTRTSGAATSGAASGTAPSSAETSNAAAYTTAYGSLFMGIAGVIFMAL